MPYITRPSPNAPAGVVRSPSRFCVETPRWPSQADHGPPAARQQRPDLRQRRSVPRVEARTGATTVTSCLAEPVEASWFARVGGQPAERAGPPEAEAAAKTATQLVTTTHLIVPADYVAMRLFLLVALALQVPPFTHSVLPVTRAQLPYSWHPGCPVPPSQLRRLRLTYWGFDRRLHTGTLVVNADAVGDLVSVFARLYAA